MGQHVNFSFDMHALEKNIKYLNKEKTNILKKQGK
jgi:hypothetical protein